MNLANHRVNRFFLFTYILLFLTINSLYSTYAQEPLMIGTETEDISLTDDLNIAKAQVLKYPENPEAHFNLAIALSRTSLVEEAIKELRATKKLIRKEQNAGLIDKKIEEYNKMLKSDPDAHNIRYRLAFSYYLKAYYVAKDIEKLEKQKEANEPKEKKENNKSNNSFSLNIFDSKRLAIVNENKEVKENLKNSLNSFEEILEKSPDDNWAKIYYAFILAEQFKDFEKSKKLWLEVKRDSPSNPAPYFFLGELHIKDGDLKKGIEEISKALILRASGY